MRPAERAWTDAVRDQGIEPPARVRPNALRWLGYAMWLALPERYSGWVLYDVTCATWIWRHVGRLVTLTILPASVIALILPAPLGLRLTTAIAMSVLAVAFTVVWINEDTERRLVQAGWPWTIAAPIRRRRAIITRQQRAR